MFRTSTTRRKTVAMMNLAGDTNADAQISRELQLAGIPVVDATAREAQHSEVPFTVAGQLGDFRFLRRWYYWAVAGNLPLEIAQRLYGDPIGYSDIRVAGHCMCPPPEEWAVRILGDGSHVLGDDWGNTAKGFSTAAKLALSTRPGIMGPNPVFKDDPMAANAAWYVTSYHIDTQDGLELFARTVREYCRIEATV